MKSSSPEILEFAAWAQEKGANGDEVAGWIWDELAVHVFDLKDLSAVERIAEEGLVPNSKAISLFSDEWRDHEEACKTYIESRLGETVEKIGARETKVVDVPPERAREFLRRFHIQGANKLGAAYFGLEWRGELVGLMSLGRHSRQISADRIVLDRLCFKRGYQVVGGVSKLLKAATEWARTEGFNELLTYSDNRLTPGATYEKLGFVREQNLRPDYFYVSAQGERLSKQSQKKSTSNCPTSMTEFEWASFRGLTRVYDAGKVRWVYNLHPGKHLTHRDKNSKNAARMHQSGVFKHSHLRGYFPSVKCGKAVYYSSSYELRCIYMLEADDSVAEYGRCDVFKGAEKWRNPDLRVKFVDGHVEIWEVKPESQLALEAVQAQIQDSNTYAQSLGVKFKVWSEKDSGLKGEHEIIKWGKRYHADLIGDTDFEARSREQKRITRKKNYDRQPRLEIDCAWCETKHLVRKAAVEKNIKAHGRYVCEVEGASKAGRAYRPSEHKQNPYAAEGKKACTSCTEIKPYEDFDRFHLAPDGRTPRCKECTSAYNKKAYEARKQANGGILPPKDPSPSVERRASNPLAVEGKKRCGTCDGIKLLSEFNPKKGTYDGLKPLCILCDRKRDAEYKAKRKAKSEDLAAQK